MTDDKTELTKTEARQGNSRKMNSRVLIYGLVGIIILFAAVYWFSTATYDETPTTTDGGTTLEDVPAAGDDVDAELEGLPTPAPTEEAVTEPEGSDAPAIDTPIETAPVDSEGPAPEPLATEPEAGQ
ncbi:hypothetical protein [Pelagibacterium halotolerans]|uniref:Uncharacterized protein n=1 Tax=Pelagibacterium halotolerans (strain DSM 22347 / JCM 15775 / CGMCC 1.7692 / B2) TaxID=1082931 RepID=G4R6S2_PELHB|nr:hypothetical protein [Pelagibacterium halotolerans]AEQ52234.1 hypothetical protein KKY_2225 [Pelagibacterium halotolerans B2]QJR18013.1 hypothetical protein HKM20_05920 [Pelagibacterium halotolerans]SEA94709.1 hypothetical protein SAMN05428936_11428 [Pelagibacterium halotolerans]